MKPEAIIGTGGAGLFCSIAGGYYYWVTIRVAGLLAFSSGDNSLNVSAWLWFGTLCIGLALLLTSGVLFCVSRRRKNGLPTA